MFLIKYKKIVVLRENNLSDISRKALRKVMLNHIIEDS